MSLADACSRSGAPPETVERLSAFLTLLKSWSAHTNLIGQNDLARPVRRHIHDSLQLLEHIAPGPVTIADIGSGAGFPGLILACALADRPETHICLIEARRARAAFLRQAIAVTQIPARVIHGRAENVSHETFDYVTARAVSDLPRLFTYAKGLMTTTSVGLFHKNHRAGEEVDRARTDWYFTMRQCPSRTDSLGRIMIVTDLTRRKA